MHVVVEEENLLKFLVEHGEIKEPKDHSVVLSRVVSSAERLELEYVHAVNHATSDSQRAVEAARLECLRMTIGGLRETQKQCQHLMKQAQADAARLAAENAALRRQARHKDQELHRLRWMLASDHVQDAKVDAMLTFMAAKGVDKGAGRLMLSHEREKRAFQSQLDEASALAEDLASTLRKEREAAAKKVAIEARKLQAEAGAKREELLEEEIRRLRAELNDGARAAAGLGRRHASSGSLGGRQHS